MQHIKKSLSDSLGLVIEFFSPASCVYMYVVYSVHYMNLPFGQVLKEFFGLGLLRMIFLYLYLHVHQVVSY